MIDSLYTEYLFERQGFEVIEEPGESFAAFKVSGKEFFLGELFVRRDRRRTGAFAKIMKRLLSLAHDLGCEVMTSNIHLKDPGANYTVRAGLSIGFKITASGNDVLLMSKDLRGL